MYNIKFKNRAYYIKMSQVVIWCSFEDRRCVGYTTLYEVLTIKQWEWFQKSDLKYEYEVTEHYGLLLGAQDFKVLKPSTDIKELISSLLDLHVTLCDCIACFYEEHDKCAADDCIKCKP